MHMLVSVPESMYEVTHLMQALRWVLMGIHERALSHTCCVHRCMSICGYVHICVCALLFIFSCAYIQGNKGVNACISISMIVRMWVSECVYTYECVSNCVCVFVREMCMSVCVRECGNLYLRINAAHICTHACTQIYWRTYLHICIYTHTSNTNSYFHQPYAEILSSMFGSTLDRFTMCYIQYNCCRKNAKIVKYRYSYCMFFLDQHRYS